MMGAEQDLRVDNRTHTLYFSGQAFPCDRDVEAVLPWRDHALLLSSDTDCLSLWDQDGLIRLTKVGVYPQDMAIHKDTAVVCGGADGRIHLLTLPELLPLAEYPVPGMPERICIAAESSYILTLLTEPEVHTALLTLDFCSGGYSKLAEYSGIPEAISADSSGLWITLSEGTVRLSFDTLTI